MKEKSARQPENFREEEINGFKELVKRIIEPPVLGLRTETHP